jgi:hypothetical protein
MSGRRSEPRRPGWDCAHVNGYKPRRQKKGMLELDWINALRGNISDTGPSHGREGARVLPVASFLTCAPWHLVFEKKMP